MERSDGSSYLVEVTRVRAPADRQESATISLDPKQKRLLAEDDQERTKRAEERRKNRAQAGGGE